MTTVPRTRSAQTDARFELAPARQTVYALLAGAFSAPPSAETFAAWRDLASRDEAAVLLADAVVSIHRIAEIAAANSDSERQARQEFMSLFKVPGGQYLAPYESVYRDTRDIEGQQVSGLLMGQSAIDVQKWYRLAALEISDSCRDLPDHIGLEFSYLAHLCRKEQEFLADGDKQRLHRAREMQRDFLAAHLDS